MPNEKKRWATCAGAMQREREAQNSIFHSLLRALPSGWFLSPGDALPISVIVAFSFELPFFFSTSLLDLSWTAPSVAISRLRPLRLLPATSKMHYFISFSLSFHPLYSFASLVGAEFVDVTHFASLSPHFSILCSPSLSPPPSLVGRIQLKTAHESARVCLWCVQQVHFSPVKFTYRCITAFSTVYPQYTRSCITHQQSMYIQQRAHPPHIDLIYSAGLCVPGARAFSGSPRANTKRHIPHFFR